MSFKSKLGKALAIGGAGLATALTGGGATPLLAAAIGAGSGAAGKLLQGGGVKDALGGAIGGGLGGIGGGKAGGLIKNATGGGKLNSILDTVRNVAGGVSDAGNIASNIAAGRAEGRQGEFNNAIVSNKQDLERAIAQQNAATNAADVDLARKGFAMKAPTQRAGQVALGDILAKMQDVKMNIAGVDPNAYRIEGGLRPSLLGDLARQSGGELSKQAFEALMNKTDTTFDALPKFDLPEKMTAPAPGKLDKALDIFGTVAPFAGLIPKRGASGAAPPPGWPLSFGARSTSPSFLAPGTSARLGAPPPMMPSDLAPGTRVSMGAPPPRRLELLGGNTISPASFGQPAPASGLARTISPFPFRPRG